MINRLNIDVAKDLMPEWEKPFIGCGSRFFQLMADDFDKQQTDPMLYPGLSSGESLAKIQCHTIPVAAEFDSFRRDAMDIVNKLQSVGKYVDHGMYAGVHHCWFLSEECGEHAEKFYKDMNNAFKAYVTGEEISDPIKVEDVKP